jgi:hypothetical protein
VTIAHDGGTDFMPTTGIQGFVFLDNTTPITISAAVRTDATTVTLTLASAPTSGIETLYYGYAHLDSVDVTKLIVDNAGVKLALVSSKLTGAASVDAELMESGSYVLNEAGGHTLLENQAVAFTPFIYS